LWLYIPGRLVAQLVTAKKGEILSQETLQPVDPRDVVRVEKKLELPPDAFRVSVFVQDANGEN
jgi:hypothetical protein